MRASWLATLATAVAAAKDQVKIDYTYPPILPGNNLPPNGDEIKAQPPAKESYEYVIVGSGAGGAPLAARLAMAGHSVLLIDAGGDGGRLKEVEVPALSLWASEKTDIAWNFYTRHYSDDETAKRDRKLNWRTPSGDIYAGQNPPEGSEILGNYYPRTGALGGCTVHNAMITILPAENDWRNIQQLTGDDSWSPETMKGYFKKLEKNQYLLPLPNPEAHGHDGWLHTTVTPLNLVLQDRKILSVVIAAATAMGINTDSLIGKVQGLLDSLPIKLLGQALLPVTTTAAIVDNVRQLLTYDMNNDNPDRDSKPALVQVPLAISVPDYKRSTPRTWLYDVATAKNADGSRKYKLDIALNTLVTKVNFDTTGDKPKATGVDYLHGQSLYRADPRASRSEDGGKPGSVKATREVIVSGGTFNTPQILKLSGVGPKDELKKFDIPLVKDLPGVGTNMQDRYEMGVTGAAPSNLTLVDQCTELVGPDPCYDQWERGKGIGKGVYTTNGIAVGMWNRSSVAGPDHDIWVGGIPAKFQGYFHGYSRQVLHDHNTWTWLLLKMHTRNNAGTVRLNSANPRDMPEINFHNFNEGGDQDGSDKDAQALLEGIRYADRAFEQLVPLDGKFERVWPPADVQSDEDLKQWARDEAWGHHASSSCPMGADDDPMAVLDSKFRVRGIDGLRVVDMSIFPKIMGTFPVLPLYMVSEKAADVIMADAK